MDMKTVAAAEASADTKERILDAAEALFMERGFAATSLRLITTRAKANLAAVHYHFGSKEGLIRAVFDRRLSALNAMRVENLDRLEQGAGGKPLSVEQIVRALVDASLSLIRDPRQGGVVFMRLLGRAFAEPSEHLREFLPGHYKDVVRRFKTALMRALPHLPEHEVGWRMHFAFGALAYAMAGIDALRLIAACRLKDAGDSETVIHHLVPFLVAGFRAPVPPPRHAGM